MLISLRYNVIPMLGHTPIPVLANNVGIIAQSSIPVYLIPVVSNGTNHTFVSWSFFFQAKRKRGRSPKQSGGSEDDNAMSALLSLLGAMLVYDPSRRLSAQDCLRRRDVFGRKARLHPPNVPSIDGERVADQKLGPLTGSGDHFPRERDNADDDGGKIHLDITFDNVETGKGGVGRSSAREPLRGGDEATRNAVLEGKTESSDVSIGREGETAEAALLRGVRRDGSPPAETIMEALRQDINVHIVNSDFVERRVAEIEQRQDFYVQRNEGVLGWTSPGFAEVATDGPENILCEENMDAEDYRNTKEFNHAGDEVTRDIRPGVAAVEGMQEVEDLAVDTDNYDNEEFENEDTEGETEVSEASTTELLNQGVAERSVGRSDSPSSESMKVAGHNSSPQPAREGVDSSYAVREGQVVAGDRCQIPDALRVLAASGPGGGMAKDAVERLLRHHDRANKGQGLALEHRRRASPFVAQHILWLVVWYIFSLAPLASASYLHNG